MINLIDRFLLKDDLSTYDPYDIWKTSLGIGVKKFYYKNKRLGIMPAGLLNLFDFYINNTLRIFYKKQEYPIVRAQAALALLNLYKKEQNEKYLGYAKKHIDWLLNNYSKGYSGYCWGTGFPIVISATLTYSKDTPFTTNVPYILEALHEYYQITKDENILVIIKSIYDFYENDVHVIDENEKIYITSYGPFKDRVVTNAVSYTMFSYSIFYLYLENKEYIQNKIVRMLSFIQSVQNKNGSWLYAPYDNNSFIDCFHSCFVVKNIYKSSLNISLDSKQTIDNGYKFISESFFDNKTGLCKRFEKANKPSIVKLDLYDNAEFLYLAKLLEDKPRIKKIEDAIKHRFIKDYNVFSVIDIFGIQKNRNTLRWAVMPYLLALSQ
jgi:hypothetical protein